MRISDWSSDVCSSDLHPSRFRGFFEAGRGGKLRRNDIGIIAGQKDERHVPRLQCQSAFELRPGTQFYVHQRAIGRRLIEQAERALRIADWPQNSGAGALQRVPRVLRSEEHTSELQSLKRLSYDRFCL